MSGATLPDPTEPTAEVIDLNAHRANAWSESADVPLMEVDLPAKEHGVSDGGMLLPVEHLQHASTAVTLYEALGRITNEASLKASISLLKPPHRLHSPDDLRRPGARDYYANFIIFGLQAEGEPLDYFGSARKIYGTLGRACITMDQIIKGTPRDELVRGHERTVDVLDKIVEEVLAKRIWL